MHVFCALVTLVLEMSGPREPTHELLQCVESGISFLDQVRSDNMIAQEGLNIVRRMMQQCNDQSASSDYS